MECHGLQCGFCTPGMMLTARCAARPQPRSERGGHPRGDQRPAVPLHRLPQHHQVGALGGRARRGRSCHEHERGRSRLRSRQPDRVRPDAAQGGRPLPPRSRQLPRRHHDAGHAPRGDPRQPVRPRPHRVDRHVGGRGPPEGQGRDHRRRCSTGSSWPGCRRCRPTCRPCWPPTRCATRARRSPSSSPRTATRHATRSS